MSLATYDLTLVFGCALELAEATASYLPEEYADILAQSPPQRGEEDADTVWRWHDVLDAIGVASKRVKRVLGAKGPLDAADSLRDQSTPTWEEFRSRFDYCVHPPTVRQALYKLANSAIDLSGYASVQTAEPLLRERGLRLLRQGLAQLFQGLTSAQRAEVKSFLPRTYAALGWPDNPAEEPAGYDGPEGIAEADQYRAIDIRGGFTARNADFLQEQQRILGEASKRASPANETTSAVREGAEQINHLHRLSVRCVNVVVRLHHLRHFADGVAQALPALIELREAVAALPSLPLAEDPFCRDEIVEIAGTKATSAHVAALFVAQQTWDGLQRNSLGPATGSWRGEVEGAAYTRTTFAVRRPAPTEVPWSGQVWQEICGRLASCSAPDADWFQAALALERMQASRRLNQRFAAQGVGIAIAETASAAIDPAAPKTQPQTDDPSRLESTVQKKKRKIPRDKMLEARDKWLYRQCCSGIAYKEIRAHLKISCLDKGWPMIDSIQGIRAAAARYAQRHDKNPPPSRQNL